MKIEELLKEFEIYKIDVEGRSCGSINLYKNHFKEYCDDMCLDTYNEIINANSQTIKLWLSILAERKNTNSTRNNKLSAIKQVYAFLEDEKMEKIDRNISKIKFSKVQQKETKYLDEDTIEELIYTIDNTRIKSAISVISSTGLRFNEMMQLTCNDIKRGFAVILGKGNKERKIWFSPSCLKYCNDFINYKRKNIIKNTKVDTDLLFISDGGLPMSRQSFTHSLKHYGKKIGLYWSEELSPHKLRHSFITEELNKGVPIHIVRDMAGHSNISTTNRYAHSNENMIKEFMTKDN